MTIWVRFAGALINLAVAGSIRVEKHQVACFVGTCLPHNGSYEDMRCTATHCTDDDPDYKPWYVEVCYAPQPCLAESYATHTEAFRRAKELEAMVGKKGK